MRLQEIMSGGPKFPIVASAVLCLGCFATAPTATAESIAAGNSVLVGSLGIRGLVSASVTAPELALESQADEKRLFVQFREDPGGAASPSMKFSVSLRPGKYQIVKWSLSDGGQSIGGGNELLTFEVGTQEVVCVGDLFPVAVRRERVQVRALASDATGCKELSESVASRLPGVQGRPVRRAYQKAYAEPDSSPPGRFEDVSPAPIPLVLTGILGRYLVRGASMADAFGSLVTLAPGVVTRATTVSVRICASSDGNVSHVKILDSNDVSVNAAMEHYLRSQSYEVLPLGAQTSPFCYLDLMGTMPWKK
jgi:hypothetical protein